METTKIIFLWSHVRSISTAFERAFMQREDFITFHEPFGEPCYFGPERIYHYHDNNLSAHSQYLHVTFQQIIDEILTTASNKENKKVFVKDMARHIVLPDYKTSKGNITVLPIEFLQRCKHTFILRTPEKSVRSLYRAYVSTNQDFIPEDIGYPEFQALFEFLTELTGSRPALIDASDLLANPSDIMKMYCEIGIDEEFVPNMLQWNTERVDAFDKWAGWHEQAQYSTGFNQIDKEKVESKEIVLPDDVEKLIVDSMPLYNALRQFRLHC